LKVGEQTITIDAIQVKRKHLDTISIEKKTVNKRA